MVTISGFDADSLKKGSRIRQAIVGGEYTFTSTVWGTGKDNPRQAAGLAQCPGTESINDEGRSEGATTACDCYNFAVTDLCAADGQTKCHKTGVADNTGKDCADGTAINEACMFSLQTNAIDAGIAESYEHYPCRKRIEEKWVNNNFKISENEVQQIVNS